MPLYQTYCTPLGLSKVIRLPEGRDAVRVDEILHEDGVGGGRIVDGDVDVPHLGSHEAGRGGAAELDHVRVVAGEAELAVFQDHPSARTAKLEPVRAGGFAG